MINLENYYLYTRTQVTGIEGNGWYKMMERIIGSALVLQFSLVNLKFCNRRIDTLVIRNAKNIYKEDWGSEAESKNRTKALHYKADSVNSMNTVSD